jgi:YYY domain-containing protein
MGDERKQPHELAIRLALLAILLMAAAFRFFNVNWDKGTYHIHPDERNTAMVAVDIEWPRTLAEYFDTSHSPLNPANREKAYFYGTLPLFLTKFAAIKLHMDTYDQIHLVGRVLSGLFDLGSVLLVFFLARRLFDWRVGLLAAFLLALAVLDIQGSHYFAADTFLTFFVTLTLWFIVDLAEGKGWLAFAGTGLSMGLTLACKVSVYVLVLIVILGAWLGVRRRLREGHAPGRTWLRAAGGLVLAGVLAVAVFRVAQPYAWAGPNYAGWDSLPEPWGQRLSVFQKVPEPIRAVLMPSPEWIGDISSAGEQQTGKADMPWGRQWTERTRWVFPLENMVLWGMGVPLGLAAWAGVVLVAVQMVRAARKDRRGRLAGEEDRPESAAGAEEEQESPSGGRHWEPVLVPLAWVVLLFVWQGGQFVKSVRYFLPIYPCLAMFAAYLVVAAWDWASGRARRIGARRRAGAARLAAGLLGAFVLLGTLAWALAFMSIYREPITRVQATRWMYDHVETAATLYYRTADGQPGEMQLPMPSRYEYVTNGETLSTPFTVPRDVVATGLVMNDLTGESGPTPGKFQVQLVTDEAQATAMATAEITATFGPDTRRHAAALPDVPLSKGRLYYLNTTVLDGAPLLSQGSAIANEHFDDPLPFNMDGRVAFGPSGSYRSLEVSYPGSTDAIDQLPLYDEDTPDKLTVLLDALDQADYIVMSSGRLFQSIPRLPMRYPMTTRYYDLLFAGKLGFEKVAEFHSYPRLLGIEFNDTQAEEQFTVYDHPRVLIYKKTPAYNREQVQALLGDGIDWANVAHWLNPRDVPAWKRTHQQQNDLMLSTAERRVQEQGGTWRSIFDPGSLPNRWPTVSWYVLITLLGLAALPLTVGIFGRLPDRGYILARPAAVLLLAWLAWMLTNLTPLHYTRGTILLAVGLIVLTSAALLLLPGQRRRFVQMWRRGWRLILAEEALFLLFFAVFWLIRWGNPDLWHPYMGGEKPMDFAYLNAVIKSSEFPPYDPWFAGGFLNYYYFGQVMVGTLIKLIGIVPEVAYNLTLPLWAAMTAMGAFSVTYNLIAAVVAHRAAPRSSDRPVDPAAEAAGAAGELAPHSERSEGPQAGEESERREDSWAHLLAAPLAFGLLAALFAVVLGNLGEVELLVAKLGQGIMGGFKSTIPGLAGLVRTVAGLFEVAFRGRTLPIPINEWYWNASRAIPTPPGESVITEFPFFTFLYADLHAHLIALPLTFLSLGAALAVALGGRSGLKSRIPILLFWALVIGAMRCTNTWDVPPHLLLALGALAIAELGTGERIVWRSLATVAWQLALLLVLSWSVLYRPFWTHYGSYYNSIGLWTGARTPLWAYLVVYGLFLFGIVSYLIDRSFGGRLAGPGEGQRPDPFIRRLWLSMRYGRQSSRLGRAARIAVVRDLPVSRLIWAVLAVLLAVELFLLWPGRVDAELAARGEFAYEGFAVLGLGLPIALLGLLLLTRPRISPGERLWAYVVLLGLAMSLGVEVIVLQGDIGRMNTVFKFYLQVWLMWAVAAAAGLAWLMPRLRRWRYGRTAWTVVLIILLACAALYPPLATSAKIRDRFDPALGPGLDGWAYMSTSVYRDWAGPQYDLKWDQQAIYWLLDNVQGSPAIVEGQVPEYRWGARYSINTGLPTILGWNWHQRQQRASAGDQQVWDRAADVTAIYSNTHTIAQVMDLLHKYDVRYVIVGPLEHAYYPPEGLAKFDQMVAEGLLRVAYRNEGVTIYEVVK